jgi:predicted nuclease of predicted toxin-antitoxin system
MLQILREEGIQIQLVKNVDSQLMHEATQWMEVTANKLQQEYNINIHDLDLLEEDLVAALMVVSEDSDFVPLLQAARSNNFCAISATPMAARQRKKLFLESDLVLVRENEDSVAMVPRANTLIGSTILLNLDQDSLVFGADISLESEEDDVDDGEFEYIRHAKELKRSSRDGVGIKPLENKDVFVQNFECRLHQLGVSA